MQMNTTTEHEQVTTDSPEFTELEIAEIERLDAIMRLSDHIPVWERSAA